MSTNHHTSVPVPGPLCVLFAPRLSLLVLDKLEATEAAEAHVHLADCGYCQRRLREYELLRAALHRHFGVERSAEQAQLAIPVSDATRELSSHQSAPLVFTLEDIMTADEREQHDRQAIATSLARRWNTLRPGLSPRMMTLSSVAAALILVVVATTIFAEFAARRHAPPVTTGATATPGTPDSGFTKLVTLDPEARFGHITTARDGSVWFTESTPHGNKIGRVSPNGTLTEFPVPADPQATGADLGPSVFGPDGNFWFSEGESFSDSKPRSTFASSIVRMTATGALTTFPVSDGVILALIFGPDGALWFTEGGQVGVGAKIGRLTTDGRLIEYQISTQDNGRLTDLCVGPDGAIWYARLGHRIGRLTLEGQIQEFPVPYSGIRITSGPDGALWYTEFGDDGSSPRGVPGSEIRQGFIGRITTAGVATEVPIDAHLRAQEIVSGPDQALWFTTYDPTTDRTAKLGRITTSGEVTILDTRDVGQGVYLAATPDAILMVVSNSPHLWRYRSSG